MQKIKPKGLIEVVSLKQRNSGSYFTLPKSSESPAYIAASAVPYPRCLTKSVGDLQRFAQGDF